MPGRPDRATAWFEPDRPRILAHRGLTTAGAPENTLLAFLVALTAGAVYLETDVHASADGVAVVSHDPDLARLTGRARRVNELTMAELREIPLGAGQSFCSLAELLAAFPDARLNIDIKSQGAAAPAAAAILEAGAVRRVLVGSFSGRRRRAAVGRLPGVATSASSVASAVAVAAARLGLVPIARLALRDVDAVQLPTRFGRFSTSTRGAIRALHRAGVEVHYWTIDDPEEMRALLAAGADGIVTDRVDVALAQLAS
ncbi:MAG: glycerophosphodiester phosphodiesterase [Micrococcales bacterium]|nr:glycerophosphodiester phosphodiesterase [Micrococcales bacterium]